MCQLQFQTFRFGWGISKGYPEEKYKWLTMGVEDERPQRKLKLLGLHGFRTSGEILQRQLSKWGPSVHELIDLVTTILTPKTLLSPLFQKFLSTHRGYVALQRLTHRECGVLFRFESFIRVNCRQLLWSGFQVVKMQTIVAGIQPLYLKLGNRLFLLSYDVPMSVLLQCWVNCCWPCWLFQSARRLIRLCEFIKLCACAFSFLVLTLGNSCVLGFRWSKPEKYCCHTNYQKFRNRLFPPYIWLAIWILRFLGVWLPYLDSNTRSQEFLA